MTIFREIYGLAEVAISYTYSDCQWINVLLNCVLKKTPEEIILTKKS